MQIPSKQISLTAAPRHALAQKLHCSCCCRQAVSSRPDLLPPSITDELEKLQDEIPPFPDSQAMRILAEELGRPPESVFSELTPQPVAAASLGQVQPRAGSFPVAHTIT